MYPDLSKDRVNASDLLLSQTENRWSRSDEISRICQEINPGEHRTDREIKWGIEDEDEASVKRLFSRHHLLMKQVQYLHHWRSFSPQCASHHWLRHTADHRRTLLELPTAQRGGGGRERERDGERGSERERERERGGEREGGEREREEREREREAGREGERERGRERRGRERESGREREGGRDREGERERGSQSLQTRTAAQWRRSSDSSSHNAGETHTHAPRGWFGPLPCVY